MRKMFVASLVAAVLAFVATPGASAEDQFPVPANLGASGGGRWGAAGLG